MRAAIAALLCASCGLNQSGRLSAATGGDTSNEAERASPITPLEEACGGPGELTQRGTSVIHRQPYLQQLTTSSVMIGWLTEESKGQHVEVTTPDGTPVTSAPAEVDGSTRVTEDSQMWSRIAGLEPDTTYCYALADDSGPLSARIGFRTAPTADSTRPIRVLAFGDSGGGGSDQQALLEKMFNVPSELIIHTGDIAYDNGTMDEFENNVFAIYAQLFRHMPFYPASGNHDYRTMSGAPFRDVFALPGDGQEQWYSYDYGRVHFAVIDTEASYATQAAWLERDLAATKLPWKIVYMHRPPYSSGNHGSDMKLRAALEPIFAKHGVQLVLAGHDHNYERMKTQKGIDYVVTGGGGRGTRSVGKSPFTAYSDDVIHYVYFEVGTDELVLHAIDATGKEFDSLVVPRTRG